MADGSEDGRQKLPPWAGKSERTELASFCSRARRPGPPSRRTAAGVPSCREGSPRAEIAARSANVSGPVALREEEAMAPYGRPGPVTGSETSNTHNGKLRNRGFTFSAISTPSPALSGPAPTPPAWPPSVSYPRRRTVVSPGETPTPVGPLPRADPIRAPPSVSCGSELA